MADIKSKYKAYWKGVNATRVFEAGNFELVDGKWGMFFPPSDENTDSGIYMGNAEIFKCTHKKDINGIEIYEQDKLRCDHFKEGDKQHYLYHTVYWLDEYLMFAAIADGNPVDLKTHGNTPLYSYLKNTNNVVVITKDKTL